MAFVTSSTEASSSTAASYVNMNSAKIGVSTTSPLKRALQDETFVSAVEGLGAGFGVRSGVYTAVGLVGALGQLGGSRFGGVGYCTTKNMREITGKMVGYSYL